MNTIINFTSSKEHYTADACVVWCFDNRFSCLLDEFVRYKNFTHIDLVKVAGGAKDLASPQEESSRAYILDQIQKSIKLHRTPRVVLMMHSECGAYNNTVDKSFYITELKKAKATVAEVLPHIAVETHFADFDSLRILS